MSATTIEGWNKACVYSELSIQEGVIWQITINFTAGDGPQSLDLARKFDDLAESKFAYRDFTESDLPFVRPGEKYQGIFVFASRSDAEKFRAMCLMGVK